LAQSRNITKILFATALATLAISALLASAASATIVAAKFSGPAFTKLTTSGLTLKLNGAEPKTCTASALEGYVERNFYEVSNEVGGETRFGCPFPSELTMAWAGEAFYDTVANRYFLRIKSYNVSLMSPYGAYMQEPGTTGGTWVNGSGSTPSTLTFSNETLGRTLSGSKKITEEGTFTITTSTGGLVTLSH
jgi:hypothetical protein